MLRLLPSAKAGKEMVELSRIHAASVNPHVHYDLAHLPDDQDVELKSFARRVFGSILSVFYSPDRTVTWSDLSPHQKV